MLKSFYKRVAAFTTLCLDISEISTGIKHKIKFLWSDVISEYIKLL